MKKLIIGGIAVVCFFALCACGEKKVEEKSGEEETVVNVAPRVDPDLELLGERDASGNVIESVDNTPEKAPETSVETEVQSGEAE